MRILVIDDDRVFTEPLLWALGDEGWAVELRRSVDDIFDEHGNVRGERPDCIILDVMMPWGRKYSPEDTNHGKSTGLRILQDIYKAEADIPLIVVTVRSDLNVVDLREKYCKSVKAVLVKPAMPSEVLRVLSEIFPISHDTHGEQQKKA
jgi:CheY-like chemotaxis protein